MNSKSPFFQIPKNDPIVIDYENKLCEILLRVMFDNMVAKKAIEEIASSLLNNFVIPMINEVHKAEYEFNIFPEYLKKAVRNLVAHHTWTDRQYGAICPEILSCETVLESPINLDNFLNKVKMVLTNSDKINQFDDFIQVIKLIIDNCWIYVAFYPDNLHSSDFNKIKNIVLPTREESDIRLTRVELGEPAKYAVAGRMGIHADPDDLVNREGQADASPALSAGKAEFGGVSMRKRLELIANTFDKQMQDQNNIHLFTLYRKFNEEIQNLKMKQLDQSEDYNIIQKQINHINVELNTINKTFGPSLSAMDYYSIPFIKEERNLEELGKLKKTHFEKLSESLPKVATVSASTGRVFIGLTDINAFDNKDGSLDYDKLQICANAVTAFQVTAGHHSFVECVESYNRILDYEALKAREAIDKNQKSRFPTTMISEKPQQTSTPYMDEKDKVEEKLPYGRIGGKKGYESFIHPEYKEKVMQNMEKTTTLNKNKKF